VARAWRRLGGQSQYRLTALTMLATGSNVVVWCDVVEDEESVIRMNECAT
jgi:hypothetical protein